MGYVKQASHSVESGQRTVSAIDAALPEKGSVTQQLRELSPAEVLWVAGGPEGAVTNGVLPPR